MTEKMPPGAPKLTIDGKIPEGDDDTLSDSEWEDEQPAKLNRLKEYAKKKA